MFRNWFRKKEAPLTGAPAVRRLKTYPAETGHVYQYYYEGNREGTEFVFTVSAGRTTWRESAVIVSADAVRSWEEAHARTLSAAERYAVAKMALFQAFDERALPLDMQRPIHVDEREIAAIMERLGLE
jgi:hypothetical protein